MSRTTQQATHKRAGHQAGSGEQKPKLPSCLGRTLGPVSGRNGRLEKTMCSSNQGLLMQAGAPSGCTGGARLKGHQAAAAGEGVIQGAAWHPGPAATWLIPCGRKPLGSN